MILKLNLEQLTSGDYDSMNTIVKNYYLLVHFKKYAYLCKYKSLYYL